MRLLLAILLSMVVTVSGNHATITLLSSDQTDQSITLHIDDQTIPATLVPHRVQSYDVALPPIPCNTPMIYSLMITASVSSTIVARTQAGGMRELACPYRLYIP